MNFVSLALGFAFMGLGFPFLAQGKKAEDPVQKRNKQMAGIFFIASGGVFIATFIISAMRA